MQSQQAFHRMNIAVLGAALEARPAPLVDLDVNPDNAPDDAPVSMSGLILQLSYFDSVGVVPGPVAGQLSPAADTLRLLFGRLGIHEPVDVLVSGYGKGGWDRRILGWFPSLFPPSHKQLALARLMHARAVIEEQGDGNIPEQPSRRIVNALGIPERRPAKGMFVDNLLALIHKVRQLPPWVPVLVKAERADVSSPLTNLARLVATMPHFQARGVRPDGVLGVPTLAAPQGGMLSATPTLNRLFPTVCRQEPYWALFAAYGAGCWDDVLMAWHTELPSHRTLALLRLEYALAVASGAISEPGPGAEPPPHLASLLLEH